MLARHIRPTGALHLRPTNLLYSHPDDQWWRSIWPAFRKKKMSSLFPFKSKMKFLKYSPVSFWSPLDSKVLADLSISPVAFLLIQLANLSGGHKEQRGKWRGNFVILCVFPKLCFIPETDSFRLVVLLGWASFEKQDCSRQTNSYRVRQPWFYKAFWGGSGGWAVLFLWNSSHCGLASVKRKLPVVRKGREAVGVPWETGEE
jgi:hypothetical protein